MIPDPAPPFEVSSLGPAKADMARLLSRAAALGRSAEVVALLLQMGDALRDRPREWGDPLRRSPGLQMVQYRGRLGSLFAYYSVHERIPFVVLNRVVAHPNDPLAPDSGP